MYILLVKSLPWYCEAGKCGVPCPYIYVDYSACMDSLTNSLQIFHNPQSVYLFMVQFASVAASALQMNGQCSFDTCGYKLSVT